MLRGRAFAALGRPKWCAINSFKRRCSGRPPRYRHGAISNRHTLYTVIPEGYNDPSSGPCDPLTSDNAALVLGSSSRQPREDRMWGHPFSRTRGSVVGHAIQASGRKKPILQAYCSKSAPPVRPSRPEARAAQGPVGGTIAQAMANESTRAERQQPSSGYASQPYGTSRPARAIDFKNAVPKEVRA
jgi:hypothetical protein